jgi:hypothetical protein
VSLLAQPLSTKLHHATRHSLCAQCYDEVSKEHLEYKSRVWWRKRTSGDGHPSTGYAADLTSEPGTRLKELRDREQNAWKNALAGDVKVNSLPKYVDSGVIQKLQGMRLELRFIPSLNLDPIGTDVQGYLKKLEARYPGWKNARKLYWESVKDGKFSFPMLAGQWVAVEIGEKPALRDKYPRTPLAVELGFDNDRLNISWNSIHDAIEREKQRILCDIGLPAELTDLRLLEALEWNLLANREGWGKTETWEWTNTKFCGDGHKRVIVVGNRDLGGAGCICTRSPVNSRKHLGFRAVIVLGRDEVND